MRFPASKYTRVLTLVLLGQAALFYSASRGERVPIWRPLEQFPDDIGDWRLARRGVIEKQVADVLRADDAFTGLYASAQPPSVVNLFVAYFKTQRSGQAPHSPKNCLPGAGWAPTSSGTLEVRVPGEPRPVTINRYVVSRGGEKGVVLYWYQSRRRVVASEYEAKLWLVADSIRYHRSDTALVRVWSPVIANDEIPATQAGVRFVQSVFPVLGEFLPM